MRTNESAIDEKKLSKKYCTNVPYLIRCWKSGKSDMEIALMTGVDLLILKQIRSEIEINHRRQRLEQKKVALKSSQSNRRQIFLSPLT